MQRASSTIYEHTPYKPCQSNVVQLGGVVEKFFLSSWMESMPKRSTVSLFFTLGLSKSNDADGLLNCGEIICGKSEETSWGFVIGGRICDMWFTRMLSSRDNLLFLGLALLAPADAFELKIISALEAGCGPPSEAHLFSTYLERINFSIPYPFLSKFGGNCASQCLFDLTLPIDCIKEIWSGNHVSNVVDRTFDICTPRLRWIPEHCMQMNIPKFTLAHRGALVLQSAHSLLSGSLTSPSNILVCLAWSSLETEAFPFMFANPSQRRKSKRRNEGRDGSKEGLGFSTGLGPQIQREKHVLRWREKTLMPFLLRFNFR